MYPRLPSTSKPTQETALWVGPVDLDFLFNHDTTGECQEFVVLALQEWAALTYPHPCWRETPASDARRLWLRTALGLPTAPADVASGRQSLLRWRAVTVEMRASGPHPADLDDAALDHAIASLAEAEHSAVGCVGSAARCVATAAAVRAGSDAAGGQAGRAAQAATGAAMRSITAQFERLLGLD